jgi:hypothetical protein
VRPSASIPVFIETARDLERRLLTHGGERATALAKRAAECMATFETWNHTPPTAEQRSSAVRRLLDLQRETMELFSGS